jgi:uncharacterized protein (TIGR02246 family)
MQDRKLVLAGIVALSCIIVSCAKTTNNAADTATASGTAAAAADHSADARTIAALDSGWMRNVVAKNVDSLMTYYTADAVSYGLGPPATGTDQVRALYTEMVKSTITDPKIISNTIKFSNDGSMAFDHGTYSMTMTAPGGKPSNQNGAFLNVWKRIDGQWKLVAEMSTPLPGPAK